MFKIMLDFAKHGFNFGAAMTVMPDKNCLAVHGLLVAFWQPLSSHMGGKVFFEGLIMRTAKTHGHCCNYKITRTYSIWASMLQRCSNMNCHKWSRYGGRGIKVCDRWHKFVNFLADMGEKPEGLSIDRIDNDGNYEPGNCRWATPKQQMNNSSKNTMITFDGKTQCLSAWAREIGIKKNNLSYRKNPTKLFCL